MALQINMNVAASAFGGVGVGLMSAAGNPWSINDALAQDLVNRGLATAVNWPAALPSSLTAAQAAAVAAGVSSNGGGGATRVAGPNSVFATSPLLYASQTIATSRMGRNGSIDVNIQVEDFTGGANKTILVFLGRQQIYAKLFNAGSFFNFTIKNVNSTQYQRCSERLGTLDQECFVNTEVDLPMEVFIQKVAASDNVNLIAFDTVVRSNNTLQPEATYLTAAGPQVVLESDLLLPVLPARVTGDPLSSIRALTTAPFTMPAKMFAYAVQAQSIAQAYPTTLPFPTSFIRSMEWQGTNWPTIQTAQATVAYAPVTGAAPAGINATQLAKLDALFLICSQSGGKTDMVVSLMSEFVSAPGWMAALGATNYPLTIPAAGATRTALFASLGFFCQYIIQRYTTMYPAMTWYIEPLNEPNSPGVWSGVVASFIAISQVIQDAVTSFAGGKVIMLTSSFTDYSGITFQNAGSPTIGGNTQTFHEYVGNGGAGQSAIWTYHNYQGGVFRNSINSADPYWYSPCFGQNLKMLDPLQNSSSVNNRRISLPAAWVFIFGSNTIVPGVSTAGRPFWLTESGDGFVGSRDRNYFIRQHIIAACFGVSRYMYYYTGNITTGPLPDMDVAKARQAYTDAYNFLYPGGVPVVLDYVNATFNLNKIGTRINGVTYQF